MSFDRSFLNPNLDTHVPIKVHVPKEDATNAVGRPDIPVPSIWQKSVKVVRKLDGKEAVVNTIDLATMQFRAFYPDEGPPGEDGKPSGRFAERTEWEHCKDWNVAVRFSDAELQRQEAAKVFAAEIDSLDAKELGWVKVLCDVDDDPVKALAKLNALREAGIVKGRPEALLAASADDKAKKGGK